MARLLAGMRATIRWMSLLLLFLLIVTPLAQVVMRGVFDLPFSGAEELARYFLICLTYLAASYVTCTGGQIRMEEFQVWLPPRLRWLTQLVIEAAGVGMFGFVFVTAAVTISHNMNNQTATLEMPFWLFMAPLAIGALLACIETAVVWLRLLRSGQADVKNTTLT